LSLLFYNLDLFFSLKEHEIVNILLGQRPVK